MPGIDDLVQRAAGLVQPDRRALLGICGAPGAGKTSLARTVVKRLRAAGVPVAHVPMDGFHLADAALRERGQLAAKGAIQTFDVHGYLSLLRRLRTERDHDVLAPDFERTLEQPLAAAIIVPPATQIVVTEGNYLLDDTDAWPLVRAELDEVWFVDLDDGRRRSRLVERHVKFGKDRAAAQAWVDEVDEPNARRVIARRDTADLVITEPARG
ncbi:nucleoside/nucleotide kinase family protein [Aeromicrobium wangtongii]|uniref:Nucleoside/nucleotide kinase family protein n=1 Tax=Aeromicrobium wangtongii TaxID=2969247 RepID=A0ABY5M6W0_9ACTN|nr:nucleoside/nucleotide kinase family protein [Aeromicrobium wangtongii]MCD9199545.1 nucleoside/nucleotide kinase family protein [Aeromicrobium wangtongii]UUP13898.1 nucleoside/nucleotide kinase family protein [Aeromicrobium wangtongii]